MNLSKSDFQLASTCAKKLVYKKKKYQSANDTNEYMEMLAQGGYVIGKMATLLYPDGIEVQGSTEEAIKQTDQLISENESITLFEPAFEFEQRLARIDILVKNKNKIDLIEVKSASFDSDAKKSEQNRKLAKYIRDVAFQYTIIRDCFPDAEINCYLLMPDKSKRTTIDGLAGWFKIIDSEILAEPKYEAPDCIITQEKTRFSKPEVVFLHENKPNRDEYIQQLRDFGILNYKDVGSEVLSLEPQTRLEAAKFIKILNNNLQVTPEDYTLCKACKSCEYYIQDMPECGFFECWRQHTKPFPSIFDLYYGGALGANKYLDELINSGKYQFEDLDPERFRKGDGTYGTRGERQLIQYNNTLNRSEWKSQEFKSVLDKLTYPLHFIDFETYTGAIPFHQNMRPYELLAFQWSCHTVVKPGATPVHSDWINTSNEFPNFKFAEALMDRIKESGTVLMWATHENTVLNTIYHQMEEYGYQNSDLKNWLENTATIKALNITGRLVDMNAMTLQNYFHPEMKGKTSIKKVLPAIWNNNPHLHEVPYFKPYAAIDLENQVIDPYDTLFNLVKSECKEEDLEFSEEVKGGTAAMRAYFRIRFDASMSDNARKGLKLQLLDYCKLDTMAMVMIWKHWLNLMD
jgi:hypothetical protein